jgi:hypothetical protein
LKCLEKHPTEQPSLPHAMASAIRVPAAAIIAMRGLSATCLARRDIQVQTAFTLPHETQRRYTAGRSAIAVATHWTFGFERVAEPYPLTATAPVAIGLLIGQAELPSKRRDA